VAAVGTGLRDFNLIVRLKDEGHLSPGGAVVEIGAQQLSNDVLRQREALKPIGEAFGISTVLDLPAPTESILLHGKLEHLDSAAPPARDVWQWLGFEYAAIDIDGSPGSIPLDLNFDEVPRKFRKHFQLVTNYGTTEHVANQLQAFKIIHDLVGRGGVMIHVLPAQGYLNHGLVNYNMKFFWMLARSNGYKWIYCDFGLSNESYCLPDNIRDNVRAFEKSIDQRAQGYSVVDCGISVVLQKVFDIEFVPPIDVPTGTVVTDKNLKKRYWTVFNSNAFRKRQIIARLLSELRRGCFRIGLR
jgi:hypothetical protein